MKIIITTFILFAVLFISCGKKDVTENVAADNLTKGKTETNAAKITFVELGSVNCIPCRQMQPVMRSIEEKYGKQVKVVFHDVWKDKDAGKKYNIQLIPTQVFLDENGNEFYRHEGFYAEEEIIKLLETRNVKPINN